MTQKQFSIGDALAIIEQEMQKVELPVSENFMSDPFRVWLSCIVSLRTRDTQTAKIVGPLFARVSSIADIRAIDEEELARLIYPAGFFRQKAGQLKQAAVILKEKYDDRIPSEIDDLLTLPGTGRKTANLVRTLGFGLPGICVDVHVHRISNRFGYVHTKTPDETEFALRKKLPKRYWMDINRLLVMWGQNRCFPRRPRCSDCPLAVMCPRLGVEDSR